MFASLPVCLMLCQCRVFVVACLLVFITCVLVYCASAVGAARPWANKQPHLTAHTTHDKLGCRPPRPIRPQTKTAAHGHQLLALKMWLLKLNMPNNQRALAPQRPNRQQTNKPDPAETHKLADWLAGRLDWLGARVLGCLVGGLVTWLLGWCLAGGLVGLQTHLATWRWRPLTFLQII